VAFGIVEARALGKTLAKRSTQQGINSVVLAVVGLAITVVVNLIAVNHDWKKDVTKNKLHTLSDQSIKIVKGLAFPITFKVFVSPMQIAEYEPLLDKYAYHSDKIKKEFVDVDRDPFAVQKNNIKQAGTILVESETRTVRVENLMGPDDPKAEEKLTNAIIQVAKGDKRKIYFLSGHGEHLPTDTGREGYSDLKESLEAGRYQVLDLSLLDKDKVPADADIVICAGPKTDFMEAELKTLETYVKGGGKLLMLLEPNSTATVQSFLTKFGVDWKRGKAILETNRLQQLAGGNPLTPIVTSYDTNHEITRDAKQLSLFPIATPVEKAANVPNGYLVNSLFSSSGRSLEVDLKGDKVQVNEKTDRKGPLSMAVAVSGKVEGKVEKPKDEKADPAKKDEEKKENEFRMVVVGDSDFGSNGVKRFGINSDLFQNMLSWLSHEEDLISIRPRTAGTSELEITEERARVINLASIVFAPFFLFLSGFGVWYNRRRK
jgi:ABC-type uncharacterized transport system involved in gliding motility auxiliary subunit